MAKLSREDALTFYKRFYAPNNAIVVVTGDVTADEVQGAGRGSLRQPASQSATSRPRVRPQEPAAARRAPRGAEGSARRQRLGAPLLSGAQPSPTAAPGEAEALYLLMKIAGQRQHQPPLSEAGGGGEDRLQRRRLVLGHRPRQRLASASTPWRPRASASTRWSRASTRSLHELAREAVSPTHELERAKKAFIAEFVYESDSQARWPGATARGWLLGLTIEQINDWPAAIAKVTAEDVKDASLPSIWISASSVTGTLHPGAAGSPRTLPPSLRRRPRSAEGRTVMTFRRSGNARGPARRSALGSCPAAGPGACSRPHVAHPRRAQAMKIQR